jgi:membrane-bound ClpP family serine protease
MADWIGIAILLIVGIVLVVLEIVLLPGGIVGIIGGAVMAVAIFLTFKNHGTTSGLLVSAIAAVVFVGTLIYGFKTNLWSKVALNDANTSRVFENDDIKVVVGDRGKTLSALRPIGNAEFNEIEIEVRTMGEYMDSGQFVKIVLIKENKIYVEKIS